MKRLAVFSFPARLISAVPLQTHNSHRLRREMALAVLLWSADRVRFLAFAFLSFPLLSCNQPWPLVSLRVYPQHQPSPRSWLFTLILSPTFYHNSSLGECHSLTCSLAGVKPICHVRLSTTWRRRNYRSFSSASSAVTFRANCDKPSDEVISAC